MSDEQTTTDTKNSSKRDAATYKNANSQYSSDHRPSKNEVKFKVRVSENNDEESSVMPASNSCNNNNNSNNESGISGSRRARIVTTPSFDLYYPAHKADDRQTTYTRQSRTSFSLEAPPRVPIEGDPRPSVEPPRSVGQQRRCIQEVRSKTVTFTDGLAGALEQRIHRLKRMPTPFWQRKDIKPQAEGDEEQQTPDSDCGGGAGPDVAQLSINSNVGSGDSLTTASGRNSSEATPAVGRSAGSSPLRSLSVKDGGRAKGGEASIDRPRDRSPQDRKCSLPLSVTRRFTGDELLVVPTEHSIDHLAQ